MSLAVFPNHGIGDSIVCNGMCRVLSRREDSILWVAGSNEFETIRVMFSDLKNVSVVNGINYTEARKINLPAGCRTLGLGFFSASGFSWKYKKWDLEIYEQSEVPFRERWNSFSLPWTLLPKRGLRQNLVALVHDIPERGIVIGNPQKFTSLPILRITQRPSFWDWVDAICSASELHFVDSAYLNLAESLYVLGFLRETRLVFHYYAKHKKYGAIPPTLRAPWEILYES
jgi:hypothetical protein